MYCGPQKDPGIEQVPSSSHGVHKPQTLGRTREQESLREPPVAFNPEVNSKCEIKAALEVPMIHILPLTLAPVAVGRGSFLKW